MGEEMGERANSYSYQELLTCGTGQLLGQGNAQLMLGEGKYWNRFLLVCAIICEGITLVGNGSRRTGGTSGRGLFGSKAGLGLEVKGL